MKKLITALAAAVLFATLLAGCGSCQQHGF